jgi:rubredoxin
MTGFENFGKPSNVEDDAKMECGVCWHVYDPAEGDGVWQIPPGTPFTALPEDWRCPNCDAAQSRFMRLGDTRLGENE